MGKFITKTYQCEWQVVRQEVDDLGRNIRLAKVLARFPNRDLAVAALPTYGKEHEHVAGRWIPLEAPHSHVELHVRYAEVPIDSQEDYWREKYTKVAKELNELTVVAQEAVRAWDWWKEDEYDRCQSVPAKGIDDLRKIVYCCSHCGGEGWLWGNELRHANEDTYNDSCTKYTCDYCGGTGILEDEDDD